jgi:hypothetical protein
VEAPDEERAVAAARSVVAALGLDADGDVDVLQSSNRLTLRLRPCDVVARIAPVALRPAAQLEVELAPRLAEAGCPVAVLDPRVEPVAYERDGFVLNLWTYYEPQPGAIAPADYAQALEDLHAGMRAVDLAMAHFTTRVAEAHAIVDSLERSPELTLQDRELLRDALRAHTRAIDDPGADEQLLHAEPHPGNLLHTTQGPLFIDLETCCRGPIELDLAHVPERVLGHYRGVDPARLAECRALVLALVAAWRWDRTDDFPDGARAGRALVDALRQGPPWPTLDEVMVG